MLEHAVQIDAGRALVSGRLLADITRALPTHPVDVTVDAFPDAHFKAHVDSIQRGTGAYFSALPAENATGNFVKVAQRVPVKIVFDDDAVSRYAIGPGMSVTPDVVLP